MEPDPVTTNPELYRVVLENERVRVLEYRDRPGDRTQVHGHPDSVMVSVSRIRRRLIHGERSAEVEIEPGVARWVPAQEHAGENIGDAEAHALFIELKEPARDGGPADVHLGPAGG